MGFGRWAWRIAYGPKPLAQGPEARFPLPQQIEPQKRQYLLNDLARGGAVIGDIECMRAFSVIHECERHVESQAFHDEAIDCHVQTGGLILSGPCDKQRRLVGEVVYRLARAGVGEAESPSGLRDSASPIQIQRVTIREHRAPERL